MPVTIDKFEYATDLAVQAAWGSSRLNIIPDMTSNTEPSGVCSGSSLYASNSDYYYPFGKVSNGWLTALGAMPCSIQYQFASATVIASYKIMPWSIDTFPQRSPSAWKFQGSNNGTDWTDLDSRTNYTSWVINTLSTFTISSPASYSYYRIYITANGGNTYTGIKEIEMLSPIITIASESTIKEEGDYSMKVVAPQTISLNKTLTRTCSPTLNFTDQDEIKFKIRSSRTGTNLKIGFHDSGGTTTESNIAISSADTFEEKTIDISAVANANKDAIDLITITVTNADAENTIYWDAMKGYVTGEGTGSGGITNAINVSILTPSGWQKGI